MNKEMIEPYSDYLIASFGQTDEWIVVYNYERPHDSLDDMTPAEYKQVA